MALTNWAAFLAAIKDKYEYPKHVVTPSSLLAQAGFGDPHMFATFWFSAGGGTITTAVAPDSTTAGAFKRRISSGDQILMSSLQAVDPFQWAEFAPGGLLVDRLSHAGGFTNVTTLQNAASGANLPTAALTRYTSGEGVFAAIHTNASGNNLGATATTANIIYTNQAGTGSRTGTYLHNGSATLFGPMVGMFSLQAGDSGIRSIESFQWITSAPTGTTAVVLFKPLAFLPIILAGERPFANIIPGWNNAIDASACLDFWPNLIPGDSPPTTQYILSLTLVDV